MRHHTQHPSLEAALRRANLPCTPQRMAIFAVLTSLKGHPTADDVFMAVKPQSPSISKDTVYRTLSLFEELGLLDRVEMAAHGVRFEPNRHPHHHLVCTDCGQVTDVDWHALDTTPLPALPGGWGQTRRPQAVIRGVCPACRHHQNGGTTHESD